MHEARFTPIDDAVRAGRWEHAEALARDLLAAEPQHGGLWNRLGNALWGQKRFAEAAGAYRKATALAPQSPEAFANLAHTLLSLGQVEETVHLCSSAARAAPESFAPHYYLGLALMREQRTREAVRALKRAVKRKPGSADAYHVLGDALWELRREDEAVAAYREAVRIQPDFAEVLVHLGYFAYLRKRMDEAQELLRRAVSASPEYASAHYYLGLIHSEESRIAESIAAFQRAVACSPNWVEARVDLAYAFSAYGRLQAAELEAREAVRLGPEVISGHIALVSVLTQDSRQSEAEAAARLALTLAPGHAGLHSRLAEIQYHLGKLDEAEKTAHAAIGLDESLPYPHYLLGVLCMQREDRAQAMEHFQSYRQRSPEDSMGVALYLAQLDVAKVPERSPDSYLNRIYYTRAAFWDQTPASERPYRGATMVANALARLNPARDLDILDAGCGTGLVGDLVHDRARRLDGVDLSPHMLEKAAAKRIYHKLEQGDLVAYMQSSAGAYDVITSAATLIHFGDLNPVFSAAACALKRSGLFIFTLFPHAGSGVIVNPYSCYSHSLDYVERSASAAGFAVELAEQDVHEYNSGNPVNGWIIGLRFVK